MIAPSPVKIAAPLNPTQMHLLQMFSFNKSDESLYELKSVLLDYYRRKVDDVTDEFWETHQLDNLKMDALMYGHDRSSPK